MNGTMLQGFSWYLPANGWAVFRTLGGRLSVYLPERMAERLEHDPVLRRIVRETSGS